MKTKNVKKPYQCRAEAVQEFKVVDRGDDGLIFLGSKELTGQSNIGREHRSLRDGRR